MTRHRILSELVQRRVFRVGAAYLVTAWLVLQLAAIVFPMLAAPIWVMKVLLALLALGFVVTMSVAWGLDVTPVQAGHASSKSGKLGKAGKAANVHSEDAHPWRRKSDRVGGLSIATIVLLVASLGVLAISLYRTQHAGQGAQAIPSSARNRALPVDRKSIAVLPFENLSPDKDNVYFAGGMQQEILTQLAAIRALKVISRNSTDGYASRPDDLKTVALQLGVATVLEGSVQKAADKVHINVQLVDALTNAHLWADSYDGDIKDMFGVERDVASKVAEALQAQLLPAEAARLASVPTRDPQAYDLYLRAGQHAYTAWQQDALLPMELPQAIALYQQALQRDPDFALVAAALGRAQMRMYFGAPDHTAVRLASAKQAIDRALALQPGMGEAHFAMGLYDYWGHHDYAAALQQFELARHVLPNDVDVESMFAFIARRRGQWDLAVQGLRRATQLDPRRPDFFVQLALTYQMLRRYADADAAYVSAVIGPRDPITVRLDLGENSILWKGDLGPLRTALSELKPGTEEYTANVANFSILYWLSRDYAAAARMASADKDEMWPDQSNVVLPRDLYLAWALHAAGDRAKADALFGAVATRMHVAVIKNPDDPDMQIALGLAEAGLGHKQEALRAGTRATQLVPVKLDAISGAGYLARLAQIQAQVGATDQAIALLQELLAMPSGNIISVAVLRLDPVWDPLRKDPRFKVLLK